MGLKMSMYGSIALHYWDRFINFIHQQANCDVKRIVCHKKLSTNANCTAVMLLKIYCYVFFAQASKWCMRVRRQNTAQHNQKCKLFFQIMIFSRPCFYPWRIFLMPRMLSAFSLHTLTCSRHRAEIIKRVQILCCIDFAYYLKPNIEQPGNPCNKQT